MPHRIQNMFKLFDLAAVGNFMMIAYSYMIAGLQDVQSFAEFIFFIVGGIATVIWLIYRAANEIKKFKEKKTNNITDNKE